MTIQNDPRTSHPLADQSSWWATDSSTKEAEADLNEKLKDNFVEEQTVLEQSKGN